MKKLFLPAIAALLFTACKEKGPDIDFGGARAFDTTYTVSTIEAAQPHRVLIEEYTGVTCANCPDGHRIISDLETKYPGRIVAVGYHPYGQGQANPKTGISRFDFRNEEATGLATILGAIPYLPCGSVDRTPYNDKLLEGRASWTLRTDDRVAKITANKVNMSVNSSYVAGNREATINVKALFTEDVSQKLLLHILLVENNIVDFQEGPTKATTDTNYVHKHILRDFITPVAGSGLLDDLTVKARGRVFERTILYALPEAWNASNCRVIAFISSGEPGNQEVLQAVEGDLE